jgi:hypothetical protein
VPLAADQVKLLTQAITQHRRRDDAGARDADDGVELAGRNSGGEDRDQLFDLPVADVMNRRITVKTHPWGGRVGHPEGSSLGSVLMIKQWLWLRGLKPAQVPPSAEHGMN